MTCCELTSPRALVVKEDPVDREHVVGLSKVHHDPVGIKLRGTWAMRGGGGQEERESEETETYLYLVFLYIQAERVKK